MVTLRLLDSVVGPPWEAEGVSLLVQEVESLKVVGFWVC